jgi:hypothetical protein
VYQCLQVAPIRCWGLVCSGVMAGRTAAQPSGAVSAYMALYNILQLFGWSYILFCTVTVVRAGGGSPGVWQVGFT